jgi:hypothetical protein
MLPALDEKRLLDPYPDPSPEREYFSALRDLYASLKAEARPTEPFGLALMRALDAGKIVLRDGRVIGDPTAIMGSIEDRARFVACAFSTVSPNYMYWKSAFPSSRSYDADVVAAEAAVRRAIEESPVVRSVEW